MTQHSIANDQHHQQPTTINRIVADAQPVSRTMTYCIDEAAGAVHLPAMTFHTGCPVSAPSTSTTHAVVAPSF